MHNVTESLDNANDMSIDGNGEIVESWAVAVATTCKPWTIQKKRYLN